MPLEITRYSILAFLAVLVLAAAAGGASALVVGWARSIVRAAPAVAGAGLALTSLAALNLAVPRTCSIEPEVRNRPVISALVGDACERTALGQVQLVLLLGVSTSLAVRTATTRPPRRALGAVADR
ncbi:MAG TPA: hypothetical protein VMN58_08765 [Acidimicrobiales bacterium]|nr:hypothetical protein [Acidimicrobiales bacterium]